MATSNELIAPPKQLELLNFQYSVFLGIAISLSFAADPSTKTVSLALDLYGRPEAAVFLIYFIFDWFTANVVEKKRYQTPAHLFVRLAWVAVLGATTISLNGDGNWKLVILCGYILASTTYDWLFTITLIKERATAATVGAIFLVGIRTCVAMVLLIPTVAGLLGRQDLAQSWDKPDSPFDNLLFFVSIYVVLKFARLLYLMRLNSERAAEEDMP